MGDAVSLPYENATSGERAMAEIQRILLRFGCTQVGHMVDVEACELRVQFLWRERRVDLRCSWKGYAEAWLRAHPYNSNYRYARAAHEERALRIGQRAVYSVLRDWVKGQTTAVECGILSFEAVFMPHMLLPDGRRLLDHEPQRLLAKLQ